MGGLSRGAIKQLHGVFAGHRVVTLWRPRHYLFGKRQATSAQAPSIFTRHKEGPGSSVVPRTVTAEVATRARSGLRPGCSLQVDSFSLGTPSSSPSARSSASAFSGLHVEGSATRKCYSACHSDGWVEVKERAPGRSVHVDEPRRRSPVSSTRSVRREGTKVRCRPTLPDRSEWLVCAKPTRGFSSG